MATISFAATSDCSECDTYEKKLANMREDLVDAMSAWVVKVVDSQLLQLYSNAKEPVLLFFRHGLPLLYDGMELRRNRNYSINFFLIIQLCFVIVYFIISYTL